MTTNPDAIVVGAGPAGLVGTVRPRARGPLAATLGAGVRGVRRGREVRLPARGHGNSLPRFHLAWGTGPEVVRIFLEPVQVVLAHRHQVDEIEDGAAAGVLGIVLAPSQTARGVASNRDRVGEFEHRAAAVVVTSGGIATTST